MGEAYIQQRRLIRAFAVLCAPETRYRRILDVAVESGFASDATFVRAFRRQFGVTPGEVRALAERKTPAGANGRAPWHLELH